MQNPVWRPRARMFCRAPISKSKPNRAFAWGSSGSIAIGPAASSTVPDFDRSALAALPARGGLPARRTARILPAAVYRRVGALLRTAVGGDRGLRSEEHTSELQSLMRNSYAVFCLKKKKKSHEIKI